jgi:LytS/YehU family sensor histidine kinase
MLLQPLVENAVKHGLEPKIEGGRIDISAFRENDLLAVKISDTGLGYISAESNGVGLANIRDRLAATYAGGRARLTIEHNEAKGVTAIVTIPA